jgi:hypothetical protein
MSIRQKLADLMLLAACRMLGRWASYGLTGKVLLPLGADLQHRQAAGRVFKGRLLAETLAEPALFEPLRYSYFARERTPTLVAWAGIPNHAMQPTNWAARLVHAAFIRSRGESLDRFIDKPSLDEQRNYRHAEARNFLETHPEIDWAVIYDHPRSREAAQRHRAQRKSLH